MAAFGLNAIHPVDNPHIIGMASARTVETDLVLDIRNGPDAADRILGIQKDGEIWAQDGSVTDPTYTFEDDIDSGWYRIGANNVGLSLGGSKVVDYGTGGVAITGTLSATGAVTFGSTVYPGTFTQGDIIAATGSNTIAALNVGSARQLLQTNAGGTDPEWASNIDIPGTLDVTGAATLDSTLAVTGAATFGSTIRPVGSNADLDLGAVGAGGNIKFTTNGVIRGYFLNTGALFVGDSVNANMTVGLTINQGAADNEILALKSSDVTHTLTNETEADTYGLIKKFAATTGGLMLQGFRASGTAGGMRLVGAYAGSDDTAKTTSAVGGLIFDVAGVSTNSFAAVGADGNLAVIRNNATTRFIFDAEGTIHSVGATATDQIGNGLWFINDTANANMTLGLTINQGANDDHILAFKSSDVVTGLTTAVSDTVETDDYATFTKIWPANGGLRVQAMAEDDAAATTVLSLQSYGGTAGTGKTTADAFGLVDIRVQEHDGANATTAITADGNVLSVSAKVAAGVLVRIMVDEDGDLYSVTAAQTFDGEDDLALVRALDLVRGEDIVRQEWDDFVRYNEADLIRLGILGGPVSEGGMTNVTQLQRLHNGALVQLHTAHRKVESRTEKLEGVLRDLLAQNPTLHGREQALRLLEA